MGDVLVELLKKSPVEEIDKILYLTQGRLFPDYSDIELGIAERMVLKTMSTLRGIPEKKIEGKLWEIGDIGLVVEHFFKNKQQKTLTSWTDSETEVALTVADVHRELIKLPEKKDKDSQAMKMDVIKRMLQNATPTEAKYVARILTKNMRLGVKDMSILEAMSYMFCPGISESAEEIEGNIKNISGLLKNDAESGMGPLKSLREKKPSSIGALEIGLKSLKKELKDLDDKEKTNSGILSIRNIESEIEQIRGMIKETRSVIERAYNLSSDIGLIAINLKKGGLPSLSTISITAGIPIRSMLAERLSSLEGIFEKLGGECAFEFKYDGLRMQVHISEDGIQLFSRGLENLSMQFPDALESVRSSFKGKNAIVDGECIPLDPNTREILPFQFISRRTRRKYDLSTTSKTVTLDAHEEHGFEEKIPVALILFDCLLLDGKDLTENDYNARRDALADAFDFDENVRLSERIITKEITEAEAFFTRSINFGCEGVVAKSISSDSVYRAGKRGFHWIKFKRDYRLELADTLDLVVVGAYHGHGRRTGVFGAFLMASYNPETGAFQTVCKLGTGFDDAALSNLHKILSQISIEESPDSVEINKNMAPDVYFEPRIVFEVTAAEITFSPSHTCARSLLKKDFGLALRFPRYTGRLREDKEPESATTQEEIISMYDNQTKRKY